MGFNIVIGITRWKSFIVQQPDTHTPLLRFFQQKTKILPPFFFTELLMRTAFDTKRVDPTVLYGVDHFGQYSMIFSVLPEKWQNILCRCFPTLGFMYSVIHLDALQ